MPAPAGACTPGAWKCAPALARLWCVLQALLLHACQAGVRHEARGTPLTKHLAYDIVQGVLQVLRAGRQIGGCGTAGLVTAHAACIT